jgi:hypothetical protein
MSYCQHSHGWKEKEYHPLFYKTVQCPDLENKNKCSRGIECPFFHDINDKRVVKKQIDQQVNRPDFKYKKLPEASVHATNVNHLAELILQTASMMDEYKSCKWYNIQLTDQVRMIMLKKRVF